MDFVDLLLKSRMKDSEFCSYFETSKRTLQRYKAENKAPKSITECLKMLNGNFPKFSKKKNDFEGWSFGNNYLWTPEGERFTAGDIRAGRIASIEFERLHRESVRNRQVVMMKSDNIIQFRAKPKKSEQVA